MVPQYDDVVRYEAESDKGKRQRAKKLIRGWQREEKEEKDVKQKAEGGQTKTSSRQPENRRRREEAGRGMANDPKKYKHTRPLSIYPFTSL